MALNEREFEDYIFLIALENAVSFDGKSNPKALLGKVISKFPEIKSEMDFCLKEIENTVKQVNSLELEEQTRKLKYLNPDFFEKKEIKKNEKMVGKGQNAILIKLPNMDGKIITRFSPAPSGYLHLGHLYGIVYNFAYVEQFGGEFILRIEDTNPENIDLSNYNAIIEDVKWITGDKISAIYYQSDRMEVYYKYLRTLVDLGKAYVCECEGEVFKTYNDSSAACPHRDAPIKRQLELYDNFFNKKYKEGDAIVRFKAELENKNPALRDFPLARIKDEKHARVGNKYRFWPMYNLCTAIDDSLMNITHVIRGKDHEINGERQNMIKDALGLKKCEYYHSGRIKFEDIELSKTKLSEMIENKVYIGWDDPRVPSLISYKKRGYKAQAFRDMIIAEGISKRDSKITDVEYHKSLNYFNKQILEKEADRYFFIHNPKEIHIENIEDYNEKEIILPKHPEDKSRGSRVFKIDENYLIDNIDFDSINTGDTIRLMHFANFLVKDKKENKLVLKFISKEHDKNLNIKKNIHFLSKSSEKCYIILQDNSKLKGQCEYMDNIRENTNIQFERFGFVKYDSKNEEGERIFYFTHR